MGFIDEIRLSKQKAVQRANELMGTATRSTWTKATCLFVLSTGRTGTETLKYLMDLSGEVTSHHEPPPQLMLERKTARVEINGQPQKYEAIFSKARGYRILKAYKEGKAYVETSARLTFFAPVLKDLLPQARFVYIHRHPADIIRSGMRRRWYVDHPADFARIEPAPGEPFFEEWEKLDPFTKICWYWDAYNRFSLDVAQAMPADRFITIRARELYDGSAVPAIFSLLGIEKPPQSAIDQVLSRKINAQKKSEFPRLSEWTPEMVETMERIAGDTMEKLGYALQTV